jgi:hypothetical protein
MVRDAAVDVKGDFAESNPVPTILRVCDFLPHCHPERREAKPNGVEGPHARSQRQWLREIFSRHRLRQLVAENASTLVASQADLGCFGSTAACAALPLSMTGVEKINKVRHLSVTRTARSQLYLPLVSVTNTGRAQVYL